MKRNIPVGMWINILTIIFCTWLIVSSWFFGVAETRIAFARNVDIGSIVLILFALLSLIDPSLRSRLKENGVMLVSEFWLCAMIVIYGAGISAAFWITLVVGIGIALLQTFQLAELSFIAYKASY